MKESAREMLRVGVREVEREREREERREGGGEAIFLHVALCCFS